MDARLPIQVHLPPPAPFVDPEPLPKRVSLKRQRRRASRSRRRWRWRANAQLAALLWRLANEKTSRAERLTTSKRARKRRVLLHRDAHAHLKECVALLEAVLSEKKGHYLSLIRLAYYLRELKPIKAIKYFRQLLKHPKSKGSRASMQVTLGRLLLEKGELKSAVSVLREAKTDNGELLRAVAQYRLGQPAKAAEVLLKLSASGPPSTEVGAKIIRKLLPALWALSPAPAEALDRWKKVEWLSRDKKDLATEALEIMYEMGRRPDRSKKLLKKVPQAKPPTPREGTKASGPRFCVERLERVAQFCLYSHGWPARRFFAPPQARSLASKDKDKPKGSGSKRVWSLRLLLPPTLREKGPAGGHCGLTLRTPPKSPPPPAVSASLAKVAKCLCAETTRCLGSTPRPRKCPPPEITKLNLKLSF